jgi:hypothetical protein
MCRHAPATFLVTNAKRQCGNYWTDLSRQANSETRTPSRGVGPSSSVLTCEGRFARSLFDLNRIISVFVRSESTPENSLARIDNVNPAPFYHSNACLCLIPRS